MKQFKLFMKGKKSNLKIPKSVGRRKSEKGIQCYERQGYGHIAGDYSNRKPKKKSFNLTWDDDTSRDEEKKSESKKPDTSKEKFIAFMETSVFAT